MRLGARVVTQLGAGASTLHHAVAHGDHRANSPGRLLRIAIAALRASLARGNRLAPSEGSLHSRRAPSSQRDLFRPLTPPVADATGPLHGPRGEPRTAENHVAAVGNPALIRSPTARCAGTTLCVTMTIARIKDQ